MVNISPKTYFYVGNGAQHCAPLLLLAFFPVFLLLFLKCYLLVTRGAFFRLAARLLFQAALRALPEGHCSSPPMLIIQKKTPEKKRGFCTETEVYIP
jgi:hypothetical protein